MIKFFLFYFFLVAAVFGVYTYMKSTLTDIEKIKKLARTIILVGGVVSIVRLYSVEFALLFKESLHSTNHKIFESSIVKLKV